MKIRLTESKLNQIVLECVKSILDESERGLQSQKLYDIISQYGGFNKNSVLPASYDVHNITDNDVIGVLSNEQVKQAERTIIGQGRYRDEQGLNAWAQKIGYEVIPGDGVVAIPLGDYKNNVIVIVRNLHQANGRDGEGWDKTYQERERRKSDRENDGSKRYIPKHKRPWAWDRQWKNAYKKTPSWNRQAIDNDMQSIRDNYALGDNREKNY